LASGQSPSANPLGFDPITSTLIFGKHDAVLVDAWVEKAPEIKLRQSEQL
jgi:hypothetical protein